MSSKVKQELELLLKCTVDETYVILEGVTNSVGVLGERGEETACIMWRVKLVASETADRVVYVRDRVQ